MKRILSFALVLLACTLLCSASMSTGRVRKETRFLTDKMAYELGLNTHQYNDVYEINFDFIYSIRHLMDDVMNGDGWALDRYYERLDLRNDDLRWVLSSRQYSLFMGLNYFFRPVYVDAGRWLFRIHLHYTNHNHFYYPKPHHYKSYCGGHHREHFHNASFYRGRYKHPTYNGHFKMHENKNFHSNRKSDFGSIEFKPSDSRRPSGRPEARPAERKHTTNPRPDINRRPTTRRSEVKSESSRSSVSRKSDSRSSSTRSSVSKGIRQASKVESSRSSSRKNASRSNQ